ncbi:hypothetical protein [Ensifer sp.]|uniref:hypothetical protein n=1 Tax=Ensifer sp. TaxID=1872086 RepID=UPI002E0F7E12|nr:hypothetical protein [Ensifer sp.]
MMRLPHLRSSIASVSSDSMIELFCGYELAVNMRDALARTGDRPHLAEEYRQICLELEEEVETMLCAAALALRRGGR